MAIQQKVMDPVCGMEVDPEHAAGHSEYAGQTYHFCSAGCKARFDAEPAVWHAAAQGQPHASDGHDGLRTRTARRSASTCPSRA